MMEDQNNVNIHQTTPTKNECVKDTIALKLIAEDHGEDPRPDDFERKG